MTGDRINLGKELPDAMKGMLQLEKSVQDSGLDGKLYLLVKTRSSQINGCHFCINMHTRDAMNKYGETAQRLFLLDAWREVKDELYTKEEQAALALCEAITNVSVNAVPDDVYNEAAKLFPPKQLAALIMGIIAINSWNRMAISTHMPLN